MVSFVPRKAKSFKMKVKILRQVSHVLVERVGDASHHGHPQPHQTLSCFQGP